MALRAPGTPRVTATKAPARPATFKPAPKSAPVKTAKASPGLRPALVEQAPQKAMANDMKGEGGLVQLGAWRSHDDALQGWAKATRQAPGVLEGFSPLIVAADLPQGRWFRLRVRASAPQAVCRALEAKGVACFLVRD